MRNVGRNTPEGERIPSEPSIADGKLRDTSYTVPKGTYGNLPFREAVQTALIRKPLRLHCKRIIRRAAAIRLNRLYDGLVKRSHEAVPLSAQPSARSATGRSQVRIAKTCRAICALLEVRKAC